MKKPLLLLVDDNRAVLNALEAELMPEFADLCRVEAFDDPRAVLEALPRWVGEQRSIAVAIVDQKMPEMTGVALLEALRKETTRLNPGDEPSAGITAENPHPAGHMRAVMLTGYAGLDSAMAAKNEAGVDRYVEKPWKAEELRSAVRAAIARAAQESGASQYYVFREIHDAEEAQAALALRFEVYARTAGADHLLPTDGTERLDVDSYDEYARLFGLFFETGDEARLVGTIRVAGDEPVLLAGVLEAVLPPETALGRRLRTPRAHALPMLEYLVDRDAVVELRARLLAEGEDVMEPGRLALAPSHREGGAVGARHLARQIIEGSVSYFFFFHLKNALLTCIPPHAAFYKPYGFALAAGTQIRDTPALRTQVACLHGRSDEVPEPARARCAEIAERLAWDRQGAGAACQCRNYPSCLGGPYGSGDFLSTDLWCPALAAARLQGVAP